MYKRDATYWFDKYLKNKKILILYGPRQSGKTTFLKHYLQEQPDSLLLNCEEPEIKEILENYNPSNLRLLFGNKKVIALDEAQNINSIGRLLKLVYDSDSLNYKIIASGSSSFYLSDKLQEPLTGRNLRYHMFPLSFNEIIKNHSWLWWRQNFEEILIFGSYPGIIDLSPNDKRLNLFHLASDYLYKDILHFENIRNSTVLNKLLKSLAWQIGSSVKHNEMAQQVGISLPTVVKYLDLLEKCFVIFRLGSYSRNLRNEIKKSSKYYFWDNGILNAVINDFSSLVTRKDKGALWENYCIAERRKQTISERPDIESYFWRTYDGAEIDYIEVEDNIVKAFEFKYGKTGKFRPVRSFFESYRPEYYNFITKDNVYEFLSEK